MERKKVPDTVFFLSSQADGWPRNNLFEGVGITDNSVVMGQYGYSKWLEEQKTNNSKAPHGNSFIAGRYTLVDIHNDNELSVECDSAGMATIFLYQFDKNWAVSNSFLFLAEKVKSLNWKLTFYLPAFYGMFARTAVGKKLISENTLFEQIKFIPSNKRLIAHKNPGKITSEKIIRKDTAGDYEEYIREYYSRYASIIHSMEENNIPINADLSGGLDSRATFALTLATEKRSIPLYSQLGAEVDLEIAKSIADHYGFQLIDKDLNLRVLDTKTQYDMYCYGDVGIRNFREKPALSVSANRPVKIDGSLGEALRPPFRGSPGEWIKKFEDLVAIPEIKEEATNEFIKSLHNLEVDFDNPDDMMKFYRAFRGRIHFGRNHYHSLKWTFLSPLADPSLQMAYDQFHNKLPDGQILCDITAMGDIDLCTHRFDNPRKNFSKTNIEQSRKLVANLGGGGNLNEYKIYGGETIEDNLSETRHPNYPGIITDKINRKKEIVLLSDQIPTALKMNFLVLLQKKQEERDEIASTRLWHTFIICNELAS